MPVVVDAKYVSDYKIDVVFNNGDERIADFSNWGIGRGVYKPLKDKRIFQVILCGRLDDLIGQTVRTSPPKPFMKKANLSTNTPSQGLR